MLIGEPGTAKSYLSELLAAAVSGDSTLTIQGSAGTTEDNIKYSWNYAAAGIGRAERAVAGPGAALPGDEAGQARAASRRSPAARWRSRTCCCRC